MYSNFPESNFLQGINDVGLADSQRGFTVTDEDEKVTFFWSRNFKLRISTLQDFQMVNWMPAMAELCRKDFLAKNIAIMASMVGEESFSFWPRTFRLPEEYDAWCHYAMSQNSGPMAFILKPPLAARGESIQFATVPEQVDPNCEFIQKRIPVAQEYILNPQLINGYKTTLRVYATVTSLDPLRLYMFPDPIVRICSSKFSDELSSFGDSFAHIDSIDLNHDNMRQFQEEWAQHQSNIVIEGLRCWESVRASWVEAHGEPAVDKLWSDIKYIIVMSFLSSHTILSHWHKRLVKNGRTFELVGYDILVDQNMKAWLLEINHTPSLAPETKIGNLTKRNMLKGLFDLIDVQNTDTKLVNEAVVFYMTSSSVEGLSFAPDEVLGILPMHLLFSIVSTAVQQNRRGRWEVCFPGPDIIRYIGFLTPQTSTAVVAMWIHENPSQFQELKNHLATFKQ